MTKNLVRVALSIVESKCAAIHFEMQVAAHIATGSDMGDIGHSYKQFNEILKAAEAYIDKEVEKYLPTPLSNTLLPPHFCGLADKSTIHRITNQGVIIATMLNGIKMAIFVQASAVYHASDNHEEDSGAVTGACAPELAQTMFTTITTAYPGLINIIGTSWQGTVLTANINRKALLISFGIFSKNPVYVHRCDMGSTSLGESSHRRCTGRKNRSIQRIFGTADY